MNDLILYGIILGVWFTLQLWVFPRLGIPTCMSGGCQVPPKRSRSKAEPDLKPRFSGTVDLVNKKG